MANLIEKYAFITNASYALHGSLWPDARSIGSNYKLIQYTYQGILDPNDEEALQALVDQIGATTKHETDSAVLIPKMEAAQEGPFVCHIDVCREVVNHFEPSQE